jgi:hypothetical protein
VYIKQKTKNRPGVGPLKDARGTVIQEDGEVVELLNHFFSRVFTKEDTTNITDPEPAGCREDISEAKEVKAKIKKRRPDGAASPDGMGPYLLKQLVEEFAWPRSKVMRVSLQEGVVPATGERQMLRWCSRKGPEQTQATTAWCRSRRSAAG